MRKSSAEYNRIWRQRNPEQALSAQHRYQQRHPKKYAEITRKSNARPERKEAKRLNSARIRAERSVIFEQLKSVSCADCGVQYPHYVMDFDHIRGIKLADVTSLRTAGLDALMEEIDKCEVVCSNCHRARTWKRGHNEN